MGGTSRSAPVSGEPEESLLRASLSRCFSPSHMTGVGCSATRNTTDSGEAFSPLYLQPFTPSSLARLVSKSVRIFFTDGLAGTSLCLRALGTSILFLASVASADTETGTTCSHALLHVHRVTQRAEGPATQMSVSPLCRPGNRGSDSPSSLVPGTE